MIDHVQAEKVRSAIVRMLGGREPLPPHPERTLAWYSMGYIDTSRPLDDTAENRPKSQIALNKKVSKAKDAFCDALEALSADQRERLDLYVRSDALGNARLTVAKIAGIDGAIAALKAQLEPLERALAEDMRVLERRSELQGVLRAPKDTWAHKIAQELAQLYALETGVRPTHSVTPGQAGERAAAHGPYCTALDEIFEVLGIATGISNPAKVAIEDISDDDLAALAIERDRRKSSCRAYSTARRRRT